MERAGVEIKPQAVVLPKETDQLEQGKYGPVFPRTPACYGVTLIAKVKPGRAEAMRTYGYALGEALEEDPYLLAPLKLHYLHWVLFNDDTGFMYQGIFDTDFDKYTEDAIALFSRAGVSTIFENVHQVRPRAPCRRCSTRCSKGKGCGPRAAVNRRPDD